MVVKPKRTPILRHRKVIGETIRHYRKQAGFTQETLAERVNLNWKYIGEVERGEKITSIEALLRIAKVVKVPASDASCSWFKFGPYWDYASTHSFIRS